MRIEVKLINDAREAFLTAMACGHAKKYQRFDMEANPLCAICQVNQLRAEQERHEVQMAGISVAAAGWPGWRGCN